ncbi:MAG: 2-phosphoglycerate kinase [Cyanobacteria bacterium P01_A01_bin.80]
MLVAHPGRPWIGKNGKAVPEHVKKHYRELSMEQLFSEVLSHYQKNVIPIVKNIVESRISDLSQECIVIEGSALYPNFIIDLISNTSAIVAFWLKAEELLIQRRIKNESNFDNLDKGEKYLIYKFIERTLIYNRRMTEEIERLGLLSVYVESKLTSEELLARCMKIIESNR